MHKSIMGAGVCNLLLGCSRCGWESGERERETEGGGGGGDITIIMLNVAMSLYFHPIFRPLCSID